MRSPIKFLALGLALTLTTSAMADSLSTSGDPNLVPRGQQPLGLACGPFVLNQSTAQTVVTGSSVSCNGGAPGFLHTDNSYFRAFSLGAFPSGFSACGVRLGIETANAAGVGTTQPLTVRIYSNTGGAFPAGTRTQVGTATVNVADQALTLLDVPVSGTVPPGAELIAEVFTPSGQVAGHSFFIGSNAAGQSGPGYIQASDCGLAAPATFGAIGFPNLHLVLSVLGNAPGSADLSIVMTDAPDPVTAGTNLSYTVTMTNTGPDAAQNARFTVPLPAGTTLVSTAASLGGTCTAASPIVCTWVGATANAAVRTATIIATVAANTADGAFLNSSATAASDTSDPDPADNLSTVSTAVVTHANLSMALTDAPDPVIAGTQLTYTATLSQGGPSDAQNARFSVAIPAETTFVSSVASPGGACTGTTTVTCTWAGVTTTGTNRSATIIVNVLANVAQGTAIGATATATSDTVDPTPGNNLANATTTVNANANLAITLGDAPDAVIAGTNLTYTATLSNAGPSDAQGATITLPLPAGTSFVSAAASAGGSCNAASPVVCTWVGATTTAVTRTATIVALVSPAQLANLSATATASSSTTDLTPGNNSATAATTVNTSADLSITLTDTPDPVIAGTNLTYVATLSNAGPSDAQGATITLPLPAGTSFVSTSPSAGGSCNAVSPVACTWAGATAPAGVRSVNIIVAVSSGQTANLSATATASSPTSDPMGGNNSATAATVVEVQADLSIALTDAPDPVIAGTQLTYTAVVSNAGPSDATAVVVTLPTPTNTSFVSGSVSGGGTCAGSPVVCTVTGSMLPGSSRTATIVMLVAASTPEGSSISATATVTAGSPDPNAANNSSSTTTAVITRADLALTLSSSVSQVLTNVSVAFTASSLNQGPSDAQGVSVTVTLTPDFRYSGHTATGATCTLPQVGTTGAIVCTWAGATVPGVTRTLVVTAFSNSEGQTAVSANTASTTMDPLPGNNSSNLSVQVGYPVEEIPTLNSLGLILMGLLFGLIGFATVRRDV